MRVARRKVVGRGCYYHLMNRIAGAEGEYPFTEVDLEFGMNLVRKLSRYYLLELISMCWMGNHFHLVLYAPGAEELPDDSVIAARHNSFYNNRLDKYLDPENRASCRIVGERMIDISHFMKNFQQQFVIYYNRTYKRRGHLWADRFKSVILDRMGALWAAVKYVELNPVRAGLRNEPSDYRFSTWGWYCGSGKHPFAANFYKHLRRCHSQGERFNTFDELAAEFRAGLARTIAAEQGQSGEELEKTADRARKGSSMPLRFLKRTRHWTDGAIIGGRRFVLEMGAEFERNRERRERLKKKQLSCGLTEDGGYLYCFRRLRNV
jgi:REP element-mobilizing transposase RayT